MNEEHRNLSDIQADLTEATNEYEQAKDRERCASSEATAALNRLNYVQKEMDRAIEALKLGAPRNSDWAEVLSRLRLAVNREATAKARFRSAMRQGGAQAARWADDRLVLADGSDVPIRKPNPYDTCPGYTGAVPVFGEVGEQQHYGTSYAETLAQIQDKATRALRAMIKTLGR